MLARERDALASRQIVDQPRNMLEHPVFSTVTDAADRYADAVDQAALPLPETSTTPEDFLSNENTHPSTVLVQERRRFECRRATTDDDDVFVGVCVEIGASPRVLDAVRG